MATGASEIEVTLADVSEQPFITGLFQFYIYDFSEFEPTASERFEPAENGLFGDLDLGAYWVEPDLTPLIIRKGGLRVGFALLNVRTHSGRAADHNMAEFFVLRKHRRGGVGQAAVHAILARYPGVWEAAMAERNAAARAFWPRAVAAAPGVSEMEIIDGDGVEWTGPILRFRVAG